MLFEFAQLKQGSKMGVAPFWFFISLERKNPMCTKERRDTQSSLSLHSLVLPHLSFPHVPSRAEPSSFVLGSDLTSVTLEQAQSCIEPEPT